LGWSGLDPLPGHGPLDVLINANLNLYATNVELFGWPTGSLILIVAAAVLGARHRGDYLMLAAIAMIIGIHSFYYFSGGPDFAARYWYLILVPCAALSVRGGQLLAQRLASSLAAPHAQARVAAGVGCLCLLSVIAFIPWRAIDKYHHYLSMRSDVVRLAAQHAFGRSLVLVRGTRFPDYMSAAVYNPVDLNADEPIYAWDRAPDVRDRILRAFPDRSVWIVNGPSITHGGFELARGPIPIDELTVE
jgi:hypothetical protein